MPKYAVIGQGMHGGLWQDGEIYHLDTPKQVAYAKWKMLKLRQRFALIRDEDGVPTGDYLCPPESYGYNNHQDWPSRLTYRRHYGTLA